MSDALLESVWLGVLVPSALLVCEMLGVPDCERDPVADAEGLRVPVSDAVADCDRDWDWLAVSVTEGVVVPDGVSDKDAEPVAEAELVCEAVPDSDGEPVTLGEVDALGVADCVSEGLGAAEGVEEPDDEGVCVELGDDDSDALEESDTVPTCVGVSDCEEVPEPDCVSEGVVVCVSVALPDSLGVGESVSEGDSVTDGVGDTDGDRLSVWDALCDCVTLCVALSEVLGDRLCDGVRDVEGVCERDPVADPELLGVIELDSVPVDDCDAVEEPLVVGAGLSDADALGVAELEAVLVAEGVPRPLTVPDELGVAVTLELPVSLAVWDGEVERDIDCVELSLADCVGVGEHAILRPERRNAGHVTSTPYVAPPSIETSAATGSACAGVGTPPSPLASTTSYSETSADAVYASRK